MKTLRAARFSFAALVAVALARMVVAQGDLAPPGPPAPTFKTLQQVEPRTDLQKAPASAVDTSDAAYHFIINQPGSYYLSDNLGVTKTNGIKINTEGVTLDLNGFLIFRFGGVGGGNGVEVAAVAHRATVRNGGIRGFARGIQSILAGSFAYGCVFDSLAVGNCTDIGIFAGDGALIQSCRVHDNTGPEGIRAFTGVVLRSCTATNNTGTGIFVQDASTVTDCSAVLNGVGIQAGSGSVLTGCNASYNKQGGIFAGSGSSVINCVATQNTSTATSSAGIGTGSGCTIINSIARRNTSTAADTLTTGMGFDVGPGSTISKCTAHENRGSGIRLSSDCTARENQSSANGLSGQGAGIHATSSDSRIESNSVTDNDLGIYVEVSGNLIVRNSAANNSVNYEIVANNIYGPIINRVSPSPTPAAVSGNGTGSGSISTTDPWANISY